MGTKTKWFRRRGKCRKRCRELGILCECGVIYLAERHCRVMLNDCLGTTDEKIAEIRRRDIHIAVERGDYQSGKILFKDAVRELFEDLVTGKAAKTRANYESLLRLHILPWFGQAPLSVIETGDLVKYQRHRENKDGAGEVMLRQELWLVRWVLKHYGRVVEPAGEPYRKPHKPVDRFPEEAQVLAITGKIRSVLYRAVSLTAAYSGLRKGDTLRLRWSMFDFPGGFIRFRQKKTGRWTRVPLHEKLIEAVSLVPRGLGDAPVFPGATVHGLNDHWSRAREKAGLDWVRFHDLRHFYCSYLASKGIDLGRIKELVGHKSIKSTERYAKYSDQALKDAVEPFVAKPLPETDEEARTH